MATFEVDLPTLRSTATSLADDATAVGTAGSDAAGAAGDASGACDGGALATALRGFAQEMTARARSASSDTAEAGTNLTGNADRYAGDDSSAASALDQAAQAFDGPAAGSRWVTAL